MLVNAAKIMADAARSIPTLYDISVSLLYRFISGLIDSQLSAHRYYSTTQRSILRVAVVMLAPIFITLRPSAVKGRA